MKHLFLDANIIIDFAANREPFALDAAKIFELAEKNKIKLYASAVSYNVIYYILRRHLGHDGTISYLKDLSSLLIILDVTQAVIRNALESANYDFEDAIQYYTALNNQAIEAIVTRDKKGFRELKIPVFTPTDILKIITADT